MSFKKYFRLDSLLNYVIPYSDWSTCTEEMWNVKIRNLYLLCQGSWNLYQNSSKVLTAGMYGHLVGTDFNLLSLQTFGLVQAGQMKWVGKGPCSLNKWIWLLSPKPCWQSTKLPQTYICAHLILKSRLGTFKLYIFPQ